MMLPNALTFARLCTIPVIVLLIHDRHFAPACALFLVAGVTDALDGWVARRFHMTSDVGAYLDALADKALIAASLIMLQQGGLVPLWLLVIVLFRDGLILAAVAIARLLHKPITIAPLFVSKANTAAQLVLVAATLAVTAGASATLAPVLAPLQLAVAALTGLSLSAYFAVWFRHMA